jgi:DNA repair protein RecO (recombination protein O)
MNLARTAGLILRTRPLTDTSLIVHWLTRDFGRLATVAKGARRPKSPFRGQLDLFYLADLSFARSSRSELHVLREVRLLASHAGLRPELIYVQQASYCAALIEQTAEPDAPMPAVFHSFSSLLLQLPQHPAQPQTIFGFEMKWLRELGLNPNLDETNLTPGAKQILDRLLAMDWPEIFRLRLSAAQAREIRLFLHGFIIYHLERIPRGRGHALGGDESAPNLK